MARDGSADRLVAQRPRAGMSEPWRGLVGMSLLAVKPGMIGGLASYVRYVAAALVAIDRNRYVFFAADDQFEHWSAVLPGARIIPVPVDSRSATRRAVFEIVRLPTLARRHACEVLYYPNVTAPLRLRPRPVVALFDIMYRSQPHDAGPGKRAYLDFCVGVLARRDVPVVTLSEFAKQDIAERTRIPAGRITAIPAGVDDHFFSESESPPPFTLPRSYALSVAAAYPHKRLPVLIEAYEWLAQRREDLHLVLAGTSHGGPSEQRLLEKCVERSAMKHRILALPKLDWDLMPSIYRHAAVLIHASQYEGFGIPVAEAMASRVPVAAAPARAVAELLGQYGELAASWSAQDLAEAAARALAWSAPERQRRTDAARETIQSRYRWPLVAKQLHQLFMATADGGPTARGGAPDPMRRITQ